MSFLFPDMSSAPSPHENYNYAAVNRLPYAGTPGLLNDREYANQVVQSVRVGYGNFDTHNVDQQHFGRTLRDILTKAAVGEYRVNYASQQWIRCEQHGVRLLYFIQWTEYIERDRQEASLLTSRQTIHGLDNSR